jgi:gamma-glutamyltranspeptidase/glutathione hydrolase
MGGIVSAQQPLAVEAGAAAFAMGGNAVDAGLACAFVQGVVDPQMCGIGGAGTALVHDPETGDTVDFDFYPPVPLAAAPEMFVALIEQRVRWGGWKLRGFANDIGYRSICTPTFVRAAATLHARYGRLSWSELLAPAIEVAAEGAPVYHAVHDRWLRGTPGFADSLTRHTVTKAAARIFTKDGRLLEPGERMATQDYARTLTRIAEAGAEDFYRGEIARRIVDDMVANGGLIRQEDLDRAPVHQGQPLRGHYRGYTLEAPRPPGGGLVVLAALRILERFDLRALDHNGPDHLHLVAEALRAAFADWKTRTGDPAFVDNPTDELLSDDRIDALASAIAQDRRAMRATGDERLVPDAKTTTHVSVIDERGFTFTMTHTLGLASGVVTEGLGFMYNNAMVLYDPNPGGPNSIAPGRVRQHGTAACVLLKSGAPVLAIGAPGGHGICSGVVQVISNIVDFDMTPVEAVSAARIHAEGDVIQAEARIPRAVIAALTARGHAVDHSFYSYDYTSGRPHLAVRDPETGVLGGAADPRGGGMVARA